jgi:hypothetical protein
MKINAGVLELGLTDQKYDLDDDDMVLSNISWIYNSCF